MAKTQAQNHGMRRRWIVETTLGLIAREGLEAVTIRRIAGQIGFSTTAVTHYYEDKDALLLDVFRSFSLWGRKGFDERCARDPSDLHGHLVAISANDEAALEVWRAFYAFRARAVSDPRFAQEHAAYFQRCKGYIEAFIRRAHPSVADPDWVARRMICVLEGVAAQRFIDPASWPAGEIFGEIESVLDALVVRSGSARPGAPVLQRALQFEAPAIEGAAASA